MLRLTVFVAIMAASLACAAQFAPPAQYPADPDEAQALYQAALEGLNAQPIPDVPACPRAEDHLGQAIEISGLLAGRMTVQNPDSDERATTIRIQLKNGQSVCAVSGSELLGLPLEEPVRAILQVPPAEPHEARFHLSAIMREHVRAQPVERPAQPQAPSPGLTQPPAPGQGQAIGPNMALPPELRTRQPDTPRLAPFAVGVGGKPRGGREGTWDPVGVGYPVVDEARLAAWTAWILKQNRKLEPWQADWIARWVIHYSALEGVDHRLMFAMIKCESNFSPVCVSRAGAVGLTQLMPCNLKDYKVINKWNAQEQLRAGIDHFKDMLDLWTGEGRSNWEVFALGAASYNAGQNAVKRAGGIPNYRETRDYVAKLGRLFYDLVQQGYP